MPLTNDCFNEIVNLLTPHMQNEGMRQAILQPALYDTPLLNQIVFSGDANTFTVMLVRKLDTFGRVTKDKTAVTAVLEALQGHVGWDQQEEIKELITCAEAGSKVVKDDTDDVPDLPQPTNEAAREHIFISYSSADRVSFVDRLAKDLSDAGHKIWVDNLNKKYGGIIAGKPWQQELANTLNRARLVIFIITPDSIRSKWVKAELKRAGETDRSVISVVARPLKSVEDQRLLGSIKVGNQTLSGLHYRDFTVTGYADGLDALKNDIHAHR
jgi:hypothetical protein